MKTNKFLPILCVLIALISFLGCKKQTTESPATANVKTSALALNSVTKATFTTPDSVAGVVGGNWGKVNYDLANNKTGGDSVLLSFDGSLCKEIHAGNGYTLGYVDITGNSLNTIALKDVLSAPLQLVDTTAKSKENSTKNWYTYTDGKQYGLIPVKDRYVVLFKGTSILKATVLYVLQLNTVDYIPGHTSGYYFGSVTFNYKRLI
ncbi:hypothetical protein SAMN05428975_4344 [Mucilaginibacter sp. OK268]|uniref:hypothetical protein n=1 Tax=Mucilaginibacter sp. OK268 TaxID=1881048 RepID=UPI0008914C3B|nr:hypothetical protein [Mucilaginibacter sp. OK268]SDP96857.1 hypothetical protein SAMN05428975_4344 [Mucilaginibacter sp. OK268]